MEEDQPLRVVLIGTDFEVRVWEKLLTIPLGKLTTYSDLATRAGVPKAPRAVGAASARIQFHSWCRATASSARAAN